MLHQLILAMTGLNILLLLDVSVIIAILSVLPIHGLISGLHFGLRNPTISIRVISIAGTCGLVAIAIMFVVPAWMLIDGSVWMNPTSSLLPLLCAALALYAAGIWVTSMASQRLDALNWLAQFLTGPGLLISLLTSLVLTAATLLGLDWLSENFETMRNITKRFLERGVIPPTTVFLFYWGLLLLFGKWWNIMLLRRSVDRWQVDRPITVQSHIDRIQSLASESDKLDERFQFLWHRHDQSYLIPRYIAWAVPVLGFIGTVLGISLAADGIRGLIGTDTGISGLSSELGTAIAPLGIAFDTTLIALTLSVFLVGFLSLVQRIEERTLTMLELRLRERTRVR